MRQPTIISDMLPHIDTPMMIICGPSPIRYHTSTIMLAFHLIPVLIISNTAQSLKRSGFVFLFCSECQQFTRELLLALDS